jgi:hypothetical protein
MTENEGMKTAGMKVFMILILLVGELEVWFID